MSPYDGETARCRPSSPHSGEHQPASPGGSRKLLSSSEKAIEQADSVLPGKLRWAIQIAVTLLILYIMFGVAWYTGGLQPWIVDWLT